jgi:Helix-turn-helix domain
MLLPPQRRGTLSTVARPEKPVSPANGPLPEFALSLRDLRQSAGGITYRELSRRAHCSASVLSEAAGGNRLPTWSVTKAYVEACGGDTSAWQKRWRSVRESLRRPQREADWQELNARQARDLGRNDRATSRPARTPERAADAVPVASARPDPQLIRTTAQLVQAMNQLRIWHGMPSLRGLARKSDAAFGPSTLSDALKREDRLPSFRLVMAFARACGEPPDRVEEWKDAWRRLAFGRR